MEIKLKDMLTDKIFVAKTTNLDHTEAAFPDGTRLHFAGREGGEIGEESNMWKDSSGRVYGQF